MSRHLRVANISWGDSQDDFEQWLAKARSKKDPNTRK